MTVRLQVIIIKNTHEFLKNNEERPQIIFLTLSLKIDLIHSNII